MSNPDDLEDEDINFSLQRGKIAINCIMSPGMLASMLWLFCTVGFRQFLLSSGVSVTVSAEVLFPGGNFCLKGFGRFFSPEVHPGIYIYNPKP